MRKIRCAIYTRKSSDEGLEQEFNSLHAQREACVSYIASQKHEGWVLLPEHYDDGGISGGTLDRSGLQRLLRDVDEGLVDQIVVYKIDRLTRSLADFAKLVERLDAAQASFVSVTQSFNTSTSMGRLTLNVLLSFAQFEREVTAERIRDKIAASKKKGLWMGGSVPLGYDPDGRTLKVVEEEAATVRALFDLYLRHGSVKAVKQHADRMALRTKDRARKPLAARSAGAAGVAEEVGAINDVGGTTSIDTFDVGDPPDRPAPGNAPFDRGHIYYILTNPVYAGRIRHRSQVYDGSHPAIIDPAVWDDIQERLKATSGRKRGVVGSANLTSSLAGKLFDETGDRLTPTHTSKKGSRYRYYVSNRTIVGPGRKPEAQRGWRLPAKSLERQLASTIRSHLVTRLPVDLLIEPSADDLRRIQNLLAAATAEALTFGQDRGLACIAQATVAPGQLEVMLDEEAVGQWLQIAPDSINRDLLRWSVPFQLRKRGVETKLIIENGPSRVPDQTLLRNIAKAQNYYAAIQRGQTFDEIAASEGLAKHRILQVIELAFITPDIVKAIAQGAQPIGLTTKWLSRNALPTDWQAQRSIIAAL